jgi:hypothetical protein
MGQGGLAHLSQSPVPLKTASFLNRRDEPTYQKVGTRTTTSSFHYHIGEYLSAVVSGLPIHSCRSIDLAGQE